jgi:sigma-B regulation protein RsbU (phosphoserine phosphatase)
MEALAMQQTYSFAPPIAGRVLIADDQKHIVEALQLLLKGRGFLTEVVNDPTHLLRAVEAGQFDAVLMDLNYTRDTTSGAEGLDLLSQIRSMNKLLPVIVLTGWGSLDLAVEAMRRGASDFVQKPWENLQLLQKLQDQILRARAERRVQRQSDDELQEARAIQQKQLPRQLPEVADYDLAAITQPLRFVGGDYYDVVRLGPQDTLLCIADVAGKGLSAALLMSSLQATLKPLIAQRLAPRELCHRLNRILCDLTPEGKFISFFVGLLNSRDHRLTYCNAGHNPPLLVRADGQSTELDAAGAVLGQFPDWRYEQSAVQISRGDRLLVFTDGLVEACNADEEPFEEQNLVRIAQENPGASAKDLMGLLMQAASQHCGGSFQDDATLLVLTALA